jgi:hypothetical protein
MHYQTCHNSKRRIVLHTYDIDPSTIKVTIPILVLSNITALLAAAVEQALIVSRRVGRKTHLTLRNKIIK